MSNSTPNIRPKISNYSPMTSSKKTKNIQTFPLSNNNSQQLSQSLTANAKKERSQKKSNADIGVCLSKQ